jgi:Holliday junction resolvase RusA-like endonuclease
MQEFYLPFKTISLNSYYKIARNHMYVTKEGKQFKESIRNYIREHYPDAICHNEPVKLYIEFRHADRRARDLDNMNKLLLDALQGILYTNDKLIYELHTRKFIDQEFDCIRIEIHHFYGV